jgi:hypothetical protein
LKFTFLVYSPLLLSDSHPTSFIAFFITLTATNCVTAFITPALIYLKHTKRKKAAVYTAAFSQVN